MVGGKTGGRVCKGATDTVIARVRNPVLVCVRVRLRQQRHKRVRGWNWGCGRGPGSILATTERGQCDEDDSVGAVKGGE